MPPKDVVEMVLAYKHDWDWFAHHLSVMEGSVHMHHELTTSVGFSWAGSPVFTNRESSGTKTTYSSYLFQFESLMVAWLAAQALFTEAINAAPMSSAHWVAEEGVEAEEEEDVLGDNTATMKRDSERDQRACELYMRAYVILASAKVKYQEAFALRSATTECFLAEMCPNVMDAMLSLCMAMAQRLVASSNEILHEFLNHEPELRRLGKLKGPELRALITTWGLNVDLLISARCLLQESDYPGSPLERFCLTMYHLAKGKIHNLDVEYLLWKLCYSMSMVDNVDKQMRCLELARRAGHLAYLHGTLALLDPMDSSRGAGFMALAIAKEVRDHILPEADVAVTRTASWALMDKPLTDEDFQRCSMDTTFIILPHYQREIREAVFEEGPPVNGGFACSKSLENAVQWQVDWDQNLHGEKDKTN